MKLADRMNSFGEGVFAALQELKKKRVADGKWVCDLSIGAPNIPPAQHILDTLIKEVSDPANYIYAISDTKELQNAAAVWYKRRYGVDIDPATEVCSLMGSQEGLSHISLAIVDEGDTVLVPAPCYPVFGDGPRIAGANVYPMLMEKKHDYIIQLRDIPTDVARAAKMMVVSYPNNPTTAIAPDSFYKDLVRFAQDFDIIVLHDNAYSDLVFDGRSCGSFLRFEGAKDVGVEFNSLSKTYGMAGARVGFCLGNAQVVSAVKMLKSNMDYGMFLPIQKAAAVAITGDQSCVAKTCKAYEHRRDVLCDGLSSIGWRVERCVSTMFVWAKLPDKFTDSYKFAMELMERTGVLVTPGSAFGESGEGYVRMALVQDESEINRAVRTIKDSGILD